MGNFLGKQLRNYRQRNELTQKQLANILYVSDRTVSKWERGAGYPDIDTLKRIAQLLDLSLDNLLNEREPELYFEYRSTTLLFTLPLLHIVIPNLSELLWHNRQFAISTLRHKKQLIPTAHGIVSIGFFSSGLLSLGIFSRGIISIGLFARMFFSRYLNIRIILCRKPCFRSHRVGESCHRITYLWKLSCWWIQFRKYCDRLPCHRQ